jgi:hypothetical protein
MKKLLLLCLVLLPVFGYAQIPQNIFFGIDLNLDWRSLTNYQQLTYDLIERDTPDEVPYVVTDFEFSVGKIEQRFLDLGFQELLLCFPKDGRTSSKDLKPHLFLARNSYSTSDYLSRSRSDILKIKSLIVERYGEAELNAVTADYSTYKWEGALYQVVLTTRKDELTTTLMYVKK